MSSAEQHPDATDARSIADVLGSIIGETCASLEELLVAHECGLAAGWPLTLHGEQLVLRSVCMSNNRSGLSPCRLLATWIHAGRPVGFSYYRDDTLVRFHSRFNAYRCAVERIAPREQQESTGDAAQV